MSAVKKVFSSVVLCVSIVGGCVHIPTSEYPVEIPKVFHASFDHVWDNSLEVIETLDGTIITKDKSSGLITYKVFADKSGSKTYINIYIKRNHQNKLITSVYTVPYDCLSYTASRYSERGVRLEFEDFSFRKDYFSEISNMFFERLTGRLEK